MRDFFFDEGCLLNLITIFRPLLKEGVNFFLNNCCHIIGVREHEKGL
jgi:hypothetical protein